MTLYSICPSLSGLFHLPSSMLLQITTSIFLWLNNSPLYIHTPQLLWPFISGWTKVGPAAAAAAAAAAAKSLQSCLTLCDLIDGCPPGSPVPGILQARTLAWVAISFSNAWKWKVKVKSLSCVRLFVTPWTAAYQAPPSMGFPGKSTGVGCHCLLRHWPLENAN